MNFQIIDVMPFISIVAFIFTDQCGIRKTTWHLEPEIMSALNHCTSKLLTLLGIKGGALGDRLKIIMELVGTMLLKIKSLFHESYK